MMGRYCAVRSGRAKDKINLLSKYSCVVFLYIEYRCFVLFRQHSLIDNKIYDAF